MGEVAVDETPYLFVSNMADSLFLNTVGVVISLYSLHIELRKEKDPTYRALCDFNEYMSCSKVLTSKYSVGFGFVYLFFGKNHILNSRNCNLGLVFYVINICAFVVFPGWLAASIHFYGSLVSVLGCLYLMVILFLVLKDFCLVCVCIYVINGCMLYLHHSAWKQFQLVQ